MNGVLIGVSYCGTHNKGDALGSPAAVMVPPREHAEWLLGAVELYEDVIDWANCNGRVVVTACGLPPVLDIDAPGERDVMWKVMERVTVLSHPVNHGHQVGAALCLRQGLEAAGYWHYPYYVHTAEDVLPRPGAVERMLLDLDGGADYSGFRWGGGVLNCGFFACRTAYLAGVFDVGRVTQFQGLEHYLGHLFKGRPQACREGNGRLDYLTTHDYAQWRRWREKMPESPDVPAVRVMADYAEGKDKG